MPIYYFDIKDETGLLRDDVGLDLADMEVAMAEARRALADMAKQSGVDQDIEIIIHDHDEGPVRLSISIATERMSDMPRQK